VPQAPMRDVAGDGQSKRESECKKPPRWGCVWGGGEVELLIDRAQSTRRGKWEIKAGRPTNKGP
jgi:hypothetical protein